MQRLLKHTNRKFFKEKLFSHCKAHSSKSAREERVVGRRCSSCTAAQAPPQLDRPPAPLLRASGSGSTATPTPLLVQTASDADAAS